MAPGASDDTGAPGRIADENALPDRLYPMRRAIKSRVLNRRSRTLLRGRLDNESGRYGPDRDDSHGRRQ